MWRCDQIFRQTKGGKLKHVVRERYLRDDLKCSSEHCAICFDDDEEIEQEMARNDTTMGAKCLVVRNTLSAAPLKNRYLIPDVDTVLKQMDVLQYPECKAISNVIILETVWEAVKSQDLSVFNTLCTLFHSDRRFVVFANEHHQDTYVEKQANEALEERNARAIWKCAEWYQSHLQQKVEILVITDQKVDHRTDIKSQTMQQFVEDLGSAYPELQDMVAATVSSAASSREKGKSFYREHLMMSQLLAGVKSGRYFQGTIRCNRDHWLDCYVSITAKLENGEESRIAVKIRGAENVNRAIDGDIVAIELLPKNEWGSTAIATKKDLADDDDEAETPNIPEPVLNQAEFELAETKQKVNTIPHGRVVGVIKRNWRKFCGSLEVKENKIQTKSSLVIPMNRKVPKIQISTKLRDALLDQRILVAIDSWPADAFYPRGHYVKTIGPIGDKQTETKVLLIEHDIPTSEFSGKVLECLPPLDWKITAENSVGRTDLRHLPVMSIDPPGCKDIDDALHVRELDNGNLEIGVHIADVTHFVAPGSPLDKEAANRGTSTYLVDQRLDMLPGLLTTELCSLRGNEDHFAFSILWEVTPPSSDEESMKVVDVKFCKSIIHSIAAMTYDQAQVLLDDATTHVKSNVKGWGVKKLHEIATIFRKRRFDAGALTLASAEVRIVLDTKTQNPMDVKMYTLKDTNALVEEFMLLANITVSKKILRHFPTFSLLRRHPAPSKQKFAELIAAAANVGVEINVDSSKALADSLDKARRFDESQASRATDGKKKKAKLDRVEDSYFNKMIRILTTRCMMPASYFCSGELAEEEYHHYGLAAPIYTHFTSPIRRYADVVVHRLLAAAIGVCPLPAYIENKAALHDIAQNLNRRHLAAQLAGRDSVSLHTVLYFKENPTITPAVITQLDHDSIRVMLPRFGIEGKVFLCAKGGASDRVVYDDKKQLITLNGQASPALHFLDHVEVRVFVELSLGNRHELKMELTQPMAFVIPKQ